jgi:adenylate cyclase
MGTEIERKFLVMGNGYKKNAKSSKTYRQGYFSTALKHTVRVRTAGKKGYITVKGKKIGITRLEFEYEIPFADAEVMLDSLCERPLIEKIRHIIHFDGLIWEVDEYLGENKGLVVAEVELENEYQSYAIPSWLGKEVSDDNRYANSSLVRNPYRLWKKKRNKNKWNLSGMIFENMSMKKSKSGALV